MLLKKPVGVISHKLIIPECPVFLRDELRRLFTFDNPQHKEALRFSPYGYVSSNLPEHIYLYDDVNGDEGIAVPRGLDLKRLSPRSRVIFKSIRWLDERVSCPAKFPKQLTPSNEEQKYLMGCFEKDLTTNPGFGTFLYVSPTGTGKTLLQALIAKRLGQRTLILFTTDQICRAWYGCLSASFGLVYSDLGLIQRKKFVIGDTFTLASVMTLSRRKPHWPKLFKQFGTIIADEADLVTMPSFWDFLTACPAKYIIGATATDSGERGNSYYLRGCLGVTRARVKASTEDTATSMAVRKVELVSTGFKYKQKPDEVLDWHDMTEHLMTDEERNQLIVRTVIKDLMRKIPVLLVTKRVPHVMLLRDMLRERGVKVNLLTGETNQNASYTEKLVRGILSGKLDCIVATVQAIKRGANLNPLAALHLAIPLKGKDDTEQLIGRIRRRSKYKTECKVVYYLDSDVPYLFGLFKRSAVPVFRRLKIPGYVDLYMA